VRGGSRLRPNHAVWNSNSQKTVGGGGGNDTSCPCPSCRSTRSGTQLVHHRQRHEPSWPVAARARSSGGRGPAQFVFRNGNIFNILYKQFIIITDQMSSKRGTVENKRARPSWIRAEEPVKQSRSSPPLFTFPSCTNIFARRGAVSKSPCLRQRDCVRRGWPAYSYFRLWRRASVFASSRTKRPWRKQLRTRNETKKRLTWC
jgi:hypothetical protein